jgi:hypothetical protein
LIRAAHDQAPTAGAHSGATRRDDDQLGSWLSRPHRPAKADRFIGGFTAWPCLIVANTGVAVGCGLYASVTRVKSGAGPLMVLRLLDLVPVPTGWRSLRRQRSTSGAGPARRSTMRPPSRISSRTTRPQAATRQQPGGAREGCLPGRAGDLRSGCRGNLKFPEHVNNRPRRRDEPWR